MLGVYVGKKSGGHLNPAVTFANCLYRGHPWRKFPIYAISQLLGAMAGAFIVYGNYILAIDNLEGGAGVRTLTTAGVFCTYPAEFMNRTAMWFSEFVASSILMFVIFALVDPKNGNAGELFPLTLFFLIFGIGACFGWETGYAINLARDFGPRLVSYILGYGHEVWSAGGYYFWVSQSCESKKRAVIDEFLIDSHGLPFLRYCFWWFPLRRLHVRWSQPGQHPILRSPSLVPVQAKRVVQHISEAGHFEGISTFAMWL